MLSLEIMSRLAQQQQHHRNGDAPSHGGPPRVFGHTELTDRQVYSAFRDALYCFEEAKRIQRYEYVYSPQRLGVREVTGLRVMCQFPYSCLTPSPCNMGD
jgi:hypothetical protein